MKPEAVPEIPRTTNPATGKPTIDGGKAVIGILSLYDYAGAIKGQLEALIDSVVARDAPPEKPRRKLHLFK